MRARAAAAAGVFLAGIWLANWLTGTYGQLEVGGLAVTWGTFAAGVCLVARDAVFEWGGRIYVLALIAVGAVLSAVLVPNDVPEARLIAAASGIAFAVSELIDSLVYEPARARWGRATAVLLSGMVAAPIDTILFLWIAPFPLLLGAVIGQTIVKWAISGIGALGARAAGA